MKELYTVNKVGEIGGKEETDDNGNECNPAADITSQVAEQKLRQVESNVGDQQSGEQVCPPVCPVQYQQISAKNGTKTPMPTIVNTSADRANPSCNTEIILILIF